MSCLASQVEGLRAALEDGLFVIRLNRPEALNAFTRGMIDELKRLMQAAESDPETFAIAITGTGRAFCSGLDVSLLAAAADSGGAQARRFDDGEIPGLFVHLRTCSKPVICALNGIAAVGGFVLSMMCDLRFASREAQRTAGMANRGLPAEHGFELASTPPDRNLGYARHSVELAQDSRWRCARARPGRPGRRCWKWDGGPYVSTSPIFARSLRPALSHR